MATVTIPVRGATFIHNVELYVEECCSCGVVFAMAKEFEEQCRRKPGINVGKPFYCPAGHRQWYTGKSEAQQLKEKLEREKERVAYYIGHADQLAAELREEGKHHAATKGKLTKLKKRVENGVCTECHRTFTDLAQHMADKHQANTWAKHD